MKNAQRIIMNQYLAISPIFSNVKSLLILSALLTLLFIVTACGGVSIVPTLVEGSTTADPCLTDPFGDGCDTPEAESARDIKITECLDDDAAATPTCKSAVAANSCLTNPFDTACEDNADFAKYLDPAKKARTTLCTDNPFNELCIAVPAARLAFCLDTTKTTTTKTNDCVPTIAGVCEDNPFDALCTSNTNAELAFCRDDSKTHVDKTTNCGVTVTRVCNNNPFDALCTFHESAQAAFCADDTRASPTKEKDCADTAMRVCTDNPFDALCTDDLAPRLTFCRDDSKTTDTKTADCDATISGVCTDNPFNELCTDTYQVNDTDRLAFCRDDTKTPEGKAVNCTGQLITDACVADPFDTLCTGTFLVNDTDRLVFCRDGTKTPANKATNCMSAIETACVADPFDTLCTGAFLVNNTDRLAFCRDDAKTPANKVTNCMSAVETACLDNAFDALCIGDYARTNTQLLAFCRDDTKTPEGKAVNCTGQLITDACVADPFDTLCTGAFLVNDNDRLAFCRDNTKTTDTKTADCAGRVGGICTDNPFDTLCTNDRVARLAFCRDNTKTTDTKTNDCMGMISGICTANPFDSICVGDYEASTDDKVAYCRKGTFVIAVCEDTVREVCRLNPFDAFCTTHPSHRQYAVDLAGRAAYCRLGTNATDIPNCADTITDTCDDNPFDTLCVGEYEIEDADKLLWCTFVQGRSVMQAENCAPLICRNNPFDNICRDKYEVSQSDKDIFCRREKTADCRNTITQICRLNPFDEICVDDYIVNLAGRTAYCKLDMNAANIPNCAGTITDTCDNDPFDSLCLYPDPVAEGSIKLAWCTGVAARGVEQATNCVPVICNNNPFDPLCTGIYERELPVKVDFCREEILQHEDEGDCGVVIVNYSDFAAAAKAVTADPEAGNKFLQNREFPGLLLFNPTIPILNLLFFKNDPPTTLTIPNMDGELGTNTIYYTSGYLQPDGTDLGFQGNPIEGADIENPLSWFVLLESVTGDPARYYYAAIDPNANLGAVLTETTGKVTWRDARFSARRYLFFATDFTRGSEDFVLEIDFVKKEIAGHVPYINSTISADDKYYYINGKYDALGVITGFTALDNKGAINQTYLSIQQRKGTGKLAGLIGQRGVLGVFHSDDDDRSAGIGGYSGGFVATPNVYLPTSTVNASDWHKSGIALYNSPPDRDRRHSQFVRRKEFHNIKKYVESIDNDPALATRVTLHDSGYNNVYFTSGYSRHFGVNVGSYDSTRYYYAAIYSHADLGETLTQDPGGITSGIATWSGKFSSKYWKNDTESYVLDDIAFNLDVDFGNKQIAGYVPFGNGKDGDYYYINGIYDDEGVISGFVAQDNNGYGNESYVTIQNRDDLGRLTGIIGKKGALGVFISYKTGSDGYSGGFTAVPDFIVDPSSEVSPLPDPNFVVDPGRIHLAPKFVSPRGSRWKAAGEASGIVQHDSPTRDDRGSQFLLGKVFANINHNDTLGKGFRGPANVEKVQLGAGGSNIVHFTSGFTYHYGGGLPQDRHRYYYATIDSDADLGRALTPIQTDSSVIWHGRLKAVIGEDVDDDGDITPSYDIYNTDKSISLNINFVAKTASASVLDGSNNGKFILRITSWDETGVLTGNTRYGGNTGIITGLIGQNGALGAFIGTETGSDGYSGGFAVGPNVPPPNVTGESWREGDAAPNNSPPNRANRKNQFLRHTSFAYINRNDTLSKAARRDANVETVQLGASGSNIVHFTSGFTYHYNISTHDRNRYYYASIDLGADLGRPLTRTRGSAIWHGRFKAVFNGEDNGGPIPDYSVNSDDLPISLSINFGAKTAWANVRDGFGIGTFEPRITSWDAAGVFTGTIAHEGNAGDLTGIIGQNGALGAFISSTGTGTDGYSGGFAVGPNVPAPDVTGESWRQSGIARFNSPPNRANRGNQFLRHTSFAYINHNDTFAKGSRGDADVEEVQLGAGGSNTVHFTSGFTYHYNGAGEHDRNRYYYAAIDSSANLGRPLTQTSGSATWHGQFKAVFNGEDNGGTIPDYSVDFDDLPIALNIDFRNKKASADVRDGFGSGTFVARIASWDATGVFTGTMTYGGNGGDLTGIIGQNGALGTFISNPGTGENGYSGGFAVGPNVPVPDVTGKTWRQSGAARNNSPPDRDDRGNQFLRHTSFAYINDNSVLCKGCRGPAHVTTVGDVHFTSGFTYHYGAGSGNHPVDRNRYYYAAIDSNANLGAPLTQTRGSATWHGQFKAIFNGEDNGEDSYSYFVNADDLPIALNIDFGRKTASANVRDGFGIGTFAARITSWNAAGAFTGTMTHGGNAGLLTGIIGQNGALGAFISYGTGESGYSGGFAVGPNVAAPNVTGKTWRQSGIARYNSPPNRDNRKNQFLRHSSFANINHNDILCKACRGPANVTTVGDVSFASGFTFHYGAGSGHHPVDTNRYYYATISEAANVGPVITRTTGTAIWPGTLKAGYLGYGGGTFYTTNTSFDLSVNFVSKGISGLSLFHKDFPNDRYSITGNWDSNGVISGDVYQYNPFTESPIRHGTLTGIIGKSGALGAFISDTFHGQGYSGGFQASP